MQNELTNEAPLFALKSIDERCDSFENAWRNDDRIPSLSDFLDIADASFRPRLLRELVILDVAFRRERGETPSVADYLKYAPESAPLLQNAIDQAMDLSPGGDSSPCPSKSRRSTDRFLAETDYVAAEETPSTSEGSDEPLRLGNYRILEQLGRGGMGVVYKALDLSLHRFVALKVIRGSRLADSEHIQRFRSEARAAAKLDHPGIVPVYEVGEVDQQHFFAMAFVNGRGLDQIIRGVRIEAREAAEITRLVAEACHVAHEQGIVHRDIKPGNILLDENAHPRLTDFGLAKHLHESRDLTEAGNVLGTPAYMAPEQAAGLAHVVGPQADIYSLGATLYHLLTGRPPFQGSTVQEVLHQVLEVDPLAPQHINPEVPRDLETICLKCLRKDPQSRFQSAAELGADLKRWLNHEPIQARRTRYVERARLWCKRRPLVATLVSSLALLIVVTCCTVVGQHWRSKREIESTVARNRVKSSVERAVLATPETLPKAIELLRPINEQAVPVLQDRFAQGELSDAQRLQAAIALAHLGDVKTEFIVSRIAVSSDEQCRNIARALAFAPESSSFIREAAEHYSGAANTQLGELARLAIVAMSLGDTSIAVDMVNIQDDPEPRTVLIETLPDFLGRTDRLAEIVQTTPNANLKYSLILGVAQASEMREQEAELWKPILSDARSSANPGVRNAAAYALQQLGFDVDVLADDESSASGCCVANSIGTSMVEIPAGSFIRQNANESDIQTVFVSRFRLADRETTAAQFDQYLGATKSNVSNAGGPGTISQTDSENESPKNVSWNDAVLFCNWLSREEGLIPCYQSADNSWKWDRSANGYRLPTEAEWEFACRANSKTLYAHGNNESLLNKYAVYSTGELAPAGSKMPNIFGLFDMPGNIDEWCYDIYQQGYGENATAQDPIGPTHVDKPSNLITRVIRGGSFEKGAFAARSRARGRGNPHHAVAGFRIARSLSSE